MLIFLFQTSQNLPHSVLLWGFVTHLSQTNVLLSNLVWFTDPFSLSFSPRWALISNHKTNSFLATITREKRGHGSWIGVVLVLYGQVSWHTVLIFRFTPISKGAIEVDYFLASRYPFFNQQVGKESWSVTQHNTGNSLCSWRICTFGGYLKKCL